MWMKICEDPVQRDLHGFQNKILFVLYLTMQQPLRVISIRQYKINHDFLLAFYT